jgi:hypothetical protein
MHQTRVSDKQQFLSLQVLLLIYQVMIVCSTAIDYIATSLTNDVIGAVVFNCIPSDTRSNL